MPLQMRFQVPQHEVLGQEERDENAEQLPGLHEHRLAGVESGITVGVERRAGW